ASTLSPSFGIYSGYELCEARALPGTEEYADSEKYQLVRRDYDREGPENIRAFISRLNHLRREHPALRLYKNLRFHFCDNDRVLYYVKATPDLTDKLLFVVSLDPHAEQSALLTVPIHDVGIGPDETYQVHELVSGRRALWQGPTASVRLIPDEPAAIFQLLRFNRRENAFDYYF